MEHFNQLYGYIPHRTHIAATTGDLLLTPLHDYAQIYLDGKPVGTLDRRNKQNHPSPHLPTPPFLDILVANDVGRNNSSPEPCKPSPRASPPSPQPGHPLTGWQIYPFSQSPSRFANISPYLNSTQISTSNSQKAPAFYRARFNLATTGDTFLDIRALGKGALWINGHPIGRFWNQGPQQTLFIPGPWLRTTSNEIIIIDIAPSSNTSKDQRASPPPSSTGPVKDPNDQQAGVIDAPHSTMFSTADPSLRSNLRSDGNIYIWATPNKDLKSQFQNPPDDSRPMVRWWWFGTAVEKPEILRELQQMKADGIGGAELAFVYPQVLDDPAQGLINEPFAGPAMLDNVRYAQSEARKLGLRIDVTLGSGWPYGGPSTTLEEAAGHLRYVEVAIPSTATTLPQIKLSEGDSIISVSIVPGEPKHWDAAFATQTFEGNPQSLLPPANGPRTALFFISSHTRQQVKRAAVGAEGYVLDPFSHQAVATHLKAVADPLATAFGSTPPYAVFSDSLEAYGADWTPTLPAEFKKRRGYDLLPHLPALVIGGTPHAESIRHDWGQTLTELVNENYLTQINNWSIAHHTKFRSQTYGEPAVTFSSQKLAALPEGENPHWRTFSTLRWATSANHVYGNNVTSGESFTWLHSPVFRATPLDMKAEADIDFIMGENQLIFHGWPYSAPQVGEPGWSLYAAAVFNRSLTMAPGRTPDVDACDHPQNQPTYYDRASPPTR